MQKESREKLVEKNIKWTEAYTDKTKYLKDQFDAVVGPGSYFRFEGKAPDGDEYYCIIGPAKVHDPRAKFFAGVRKLPATYSAGGKYFDSLDRAAAYARDTWGVKTPQSLKPYTSKQLFGISQKVTDWKKDHDEKDSEKDDKDIEAFSINYLQKNAMPVPKRLRMEYDFDTYEAIASGQVHAFNTLANENPSFWAALDEIRDEKRARYAIYQLKYGLSLEEIRDIYRVYVGYSPDHGMYAFHLGAYMMPVADSNEFYKLISECRLVDEKVSYVGPQKIGDQYEGEPLFNGDRGEDIPDDVLKAIVTTSIIGMPKAKARKIQSLKKKASLYYADKEGAFQVYQMPYTLTKSITVDNQLEAWKEKHGLSSYDGHEELTKEQQVEHLINSGLPAIQPITLSDYSYVFSYNRGRTKGGNAGSIYTPDRRAPNGLTDWEPNMPSNSTENPDCQIFSLDKFEEAKSRNLVVSPTGTRGFLNRDGQNKLLLNTIASFPEFANELLVYLRKSGAKNGSTLEQSFRGESGYLSSLTSSMATLLYALTEIGSQANAFQIPNTPAIKNGAINYDDVSFTNGGQQQAKCGRKKYMALISTIRNFFSEEFYKETGRVFKLVKNSDLDELPERWKGFAQFVTLRNIGSSGLTGGFLNVNVARTNESFRVSSFVKNKMALLSEIAEFMAERGMEDTSEGSSKLVANYLNNGGSPSLPRNIRESRQQSVVFDEINVVPFMEEILKSRVSQDEEGNPSLLTMEQTSQVLSYKKKIMQSIYDNEHANRTKASINRPAPIGSNEVWVPQQTSFSVGMKIEIWDSSDNSQITEIVEISKLIPRVGTKIMLNDALSFAVNPSDINKCYITPCSDDDEDDSLNLVWQADAVRPDGTVGAFRTFGAYDNFHELHEYSALSAEEMMVSKQESYLKRHDPATRVTLMPIDPKTGRTDLLRIPFRYVNKPQRNYQSKDLAAKYSGRPPEVKQSLRTTRSIPELIKSFNEEFGPELMDAISAGEFEWQASTEPMERVDEEDDVLVDIPPEADETPEEEEEEEEVDEDIAGMMGNEDDFMAHLVPDGEDDENEDFGMNGNVANGEDEDDLDYGTNNASTSTVESLIKLSQELDEEGKTEESLELLRLAKKFSGNIKKG